MASPLNITRIPAPRVPLIDDRTGQISREWYRFLYNIFVLTGEGTSPITLEDVQQNPPLQIGTISSQNYDNVTITGGSIDGTPIGNNTTSSGKFTTLNATGGIGGGVF